MDFFPCFGLRDLALKFVKVFLKSLMFNKSVENSKFSFYFKTPN